MGIVVVAALVANAEVVLLVATNGAHYAYCGISSGTVASR
jgi:hypothetical protein